MSAIPTKGGLPLLGSLFQYRNDKIGFLNQLRDQLGDQVRFRLGKHSIILLTHPEDIQWIEAKNSKNYVKATNLRELVGDGILMSEGQKWHKQRRLIQPTFHQGSLMKMVDDMNLRISAYVQGVDLEVARSDSPIDVSTGLKKLVFEIVGEALFGSEIGNEFHDLRESMEYINVFLTKRFHQLVPLPLSFPTPDHRKFLKAKAQIDQVVYSIIDRKRLAIQEGQAGQDLLTKMIEARDPETGDAMSVEQLRDEAVSMLLAGFETTGHLLPWILALLCQHPEAQGDLQRELDEKLSGRIPNGEDTFQLTALNNIIDETLRLYPPIWAWTKRSLKEDQLRGAPIPAGSILYVSPYLIHRHPKIWANPNAFIPSRWTPELREKSKISFFPFGMGPRTCVGKHFALLEVKLIVIRFLQKYQLSLVDPVSVEPVFKITIDMKKPLMLRFKRRGN